MYRKILRKTISVLLGLLILINIPIIQVFHEETNNDYSNWMSENLESEKKVIDISMLGAHDAYSSDITITSEVDPYETGIASTIPGILVKGLLVKQSKTQITDTEGLMKIGVRYLDIRLSYIDEEFYTKHSYLSTKFEIIAKDIVAFLENNTAEFLILDFQHIEGLDYDNDADYLIFYNMLDEFGLADYLYTSDLKELDMITYGDVTKDKSESGIIIIDKFQDANKKTYHYSESIRSNWANDDDFEIVVSYLDKEANFVKEDSETQKLFRVAQGVTTMQMDFVGIGNGLETWSLVERAESFNSFLFESEEFDNIINQLPIIMVDYANSNNNGFVDEIMEIVIEKN